MRTRRKRWNYQHTFKGRFSRQVYVKHNFVHLNRYQKKFTWWFYILVVLRCMENIDHNIGEALGLNSFLSHRHLKLEKILTDWTISTRTGNFRKIQHGFIRSLTPGREHHCICVTSDPSYTSYLCITCRPRDHDSRWSKENVLLHGKISMITKRSDNSPLLVCLQ